MVHVYTEVPNLKDVPLVPLKRVVSSHVPNVLVIMDHILARAHSFRPISKIAENGW